MRIGILSRKASLYSIRRLVEAAEVRELGFDAIIPRMGASYTFYGTARRSSSKVHA